MNKFSIYVHVPWCRRRCPYCNFYLVVGRPRAEFVEGIQREWLSRKADFSGVAQTLYFGGGTPSLLSPVEILTIVDSFYAQAVLSPHPEITLEANPEDLSQDYVTALAQTPVNRVSLGVQSFDDDILRRLGRKHTGAMAKDAIARLKDAGLTTISVDQIIGVPGENVSRIVEDLQFLHEARVGHVSTYLLTIEEGTHFHRQNVSPSDEAQADIYTTVQQELIRLGYTQYDISSFAKPHEMSRHNQAYWAGQDYIGLGPGAHSMKRLADGDVVRINNHADIMTWLNDPISLSHWTTEKLPKDAALRESLAFGLRNMVAGIDAESLAKDFHTALPEGFDAIIGKFNDMGWLEKRGAICTITREGALFADAIMRDILCC